MSNENKPVVDAEYKELGNKACLVVHSQELAHLGVYPVEQPPNNLYGLIATKHDVERMLARWVKVGMPNPTKLNKVTDTMLKNNSHLNRLRIEDSRQIAEYRSEVNRLKIIEKDAAQVNNFIFSMSGMSLWKRLRMFLSLQYFFDLLQERTTDGWVGRFGSNYAEHTIKAYEDQASDQ